MKEDYPHILEWLTKYYPHVKEMWYYHLRDVEGEDV